MHITSNKPKKWLQANNDKTIQDLYYIILYYIIIYYYIFIIHIWWQWASIEPPCWPCQASFVILRHTIQIQKGTVLRQTALGRMQQAHQWLTLFTHGELHVTSTCGLREVIRWPHLSAPAIHPFANQASPENVLTILTLCLYWHTHMIKYVIASNSLNIIYPNIY